MSTKKRNITHIIDQNDKPLHKRMKLCLYWAGYKKGRDREGKPIDNNIYHSNCLFDYNCKNRHYLIGDERKANEAHTIHKHRHKHIKNEIIIPVDKNHHNQHRNNNNNNITTNQLPQTLLDYQLYDDSTFSTRNNQFEYRISNNIKGTCEISVKNGNFNKNIICSINQEIVQNIQFDIGSKFRANTTKINQYHQQLQNDIENISTACNGIKELTTTTTNYDKKIIHLKLQQIEKQLKQIQRNISTKNDTIKRYSLQINASSIKRDLANYDLLNKVIQQNEQITKLKITNHTLSSDKQQYHKFKQIIEYRLLLNPMSAEKGNKLCTQFMRTGECHNLLQCPKNHSIEQMIFRSIIRNDTMSLNTINKYINYSDYQFLRQNPSFFKKFLQNKGLWIKSQNQANHKHSINKQ